MRSFGWTSVRARIRRTPWVVLLAAGSLHCGSATGTNTGPPQGPFHLVFLSASPPTDTVYASPPFTVSVALTDGSGQPMANQPVRFGAGIQHLFLDSPDGSHANPDTEFTDTQGRASMTVERGSYAGTQWLQVSAPIQSLADSVGFDILPGNPAAVQVTPPDTAVVVGGAYTLLGHVLDQYGNVRSDDVVFGPDSGSVTVTGTANTVTVTGQWEGRAEILAAGRGITTSAWVSVVPSGTLAFYVRAPLTVDSIAIATANTDGSQYTALYKVPFDNAPSRPLDWAPDGQSVVFQAGPISGSALYTVTLAGTVAQLITPSIGYPEILPRYGPGGWIYFTAETDWSSGTDELWRVHADGSAPARVGPVAASGESDTYAAPSPDGTSIWFSTDRPNPGQLPVTLATLDLATDSVAYLGVYGIGAVWSPAGDRVAYVDSAGAIVVVAPDGSGGRVVSDSGKAYVPYIDWSPDGQWIVAAADTGGVDLIEPDRGMTLPLAFSGLWQHPSWRP